MYYKLLRAKTLTANTIVLKSDKDGILVYLCKASKICECAKFFYTSIFKPKRAKRENRSNFQEYSEKMEVIIYRVGDKH